MKVLKMRVGFKSTVRVFKSQIWSIERERGVRNFLQGDQLNMAVFSGILEKVTCPVYSSAHWTSHFLQGTWKTWPCLTGHPVHPWCSGGGGSVQEGDCQVLQRQHRFSQAWLWTQTFYLICKYIEFIWRTDAPRFHFIPWKETNHDLKLYDPPYSTDFYRVP